MTDSLFLFTFSPIQPFIAESRRAADLFASSAILVKLAKSAAEVVLKSGGKLIFPAALTNDVPNRLVATIQSDKAQELGEECKTALIKAWSEIARDARDEFTKGYQNTDGIWQSIWDRQINSFWEVHWAVAPLNGAGFPAAFDLINRLIESVKRTRTFTGSDMESGVKDTLSGKRSSLCTRDLNGHDYWVEAARHFSASKIKPNGAERLDTIGLIKRFSPIASKFPSTSTIASLDFRERVRGSHELRVYKECIDALGVWETDSKDTDWPYDGDLFYITMLTPQRLAKDYGCNPASENLGNAKKCLRQLYRTYGKPSPYYAIIALDGDSMGERTSRCASEDEAIQFSQDLSAFAQKVGELSIPGNSFNARVIYNGGDDVLAVAPLETAVAYASELARTFHEATGATASAGIVISHHQSQLSSALDIARKSERLAKTVPGKSAICVTVNKRSGAPYSVTSHWEDLTAFETILHWFKDNKISSKFAYDVFDESHILCALPEDAQEAGLSRLLKRHLEISSKDFDIPAAVMTINSWIKSIDRIGDQTTSGIEMVARWLVYARFVSKGGDEE